MSKNVSGNELGRLCRTPWRFAWRRRADNAISDAMGDVCGAPATKTNFRVQRRIGTEHLPHSCSNDAAVCRSNTAA